ncbi:MAG: HAD family hydrolase [Bradymonadia bacterium]
MIAFDLDGTLVDSRRDLISCVNRLRNAHGVESLDYDGAWPDVCRGMPHLYAHCFPTWMSEELNLKTAFEAIYSANIFDETFVYSGIVEMLSALHGRVALGVVTNKPQAATEQLLEAANLKHFFDVVVGGDRCEASKPSPIPLQFAHRVVKDGFNLIMVGDSVGDVRCAKAAKAISVWCNWGYWRDRDNDARFFLESPSELIDIVDANHIRLE